MGRRLNEAGQKLSRNKEWRCLGPHKSECFEAIQIARASLDEFWENRKTHGAERKRQYDMKQAEFEAKQAAWRVRTKTNISNNREKLDRAVGALNRVQDRISEIEGKIYETDSDKWRGIFGDWLSEAREKESDIEESIDRIRGWIDEDEAKL